MENASKALIIAGAILLSILIIGLGMFIYSQASGILGNTRIDKQEANAYNSEFTNYSGIISGSQARSLCDVVMQHNRSAADYSDWVIVKDSSQATETSNNCNENSKLADETSGINTLIQNVRKELKTGYTYEVDFGYSTETGHVVAIGIVRHTSK